MGEVWGVLGGEIQVPLEMICDDSDGWLGNESKNYAHISLLFVPIETYPDWSQQSMKFRLIFDLFLHDGIICQQ